MMACRVFRGVALGTMQMEVGLTATRVAAGTALQLESLPTARVFIFQRDLKEAMHFKLDIVFNAGDLLVH